MTEMTMNNGATTKYQRGVSKLRRARQRGVQILEFGLVAVVFIPALLGTFVVGMNLVRINNAKHVVRDLASLYIHNTDFSMYPNQLLAQRLATGLDLQVPSFASGVTNKNTNTSGSGSAIIYVTQLMYVGSTSDPNCVAAGTGNCTNQNSFVFTQRIVFGSSSVKTAHPSFIGDPGTVTINSQGIVANPVTTAGAKISSSGQTSLNALWKASVSSPDVTTDPVDGTIIYLVEGFFDTGSFSMGSVTSQGIYARAFF